MRSGVTMRRSLLVSAVLTFLAAVTLTTQTSDAAGTSRVAPRASAQASPAVTVTPHDDLRSGQIVTVAGTGFAPNVEMQGGQCNGDTDTDQIECDDPVHFTSDAQGAFSIPFEVRRRIRTISCGTPSSTCLIAAGESASLGTTLRLQALFFVPPINSK